jgi:hypothetical protein
LKKVQTNDRSSPLVDGMRFNFLFLVQY